MIKIMIMIKSLVSINTATQISDPTYTTTSSKGSSKFLLTVWCADREVRPAEKETIRNTACSKIIKT